jgi:hypothetical protein
MYRKHGVRVPVKLSAHAQRVAQVRGAALRAGLAELAFAQQPYVARGTFESESDFNAWLLAARASVHAATVSNELHA